MLRESIRHARRAGAGTRKSGSDSIAGRSMRARQHGLDVVARPGRRADPFTWIMFGTPLGRLACAHVPCGWALPGLCGIAPRRPACTWLSARERAQTRDGPRSRTPRRSTDARGASGGRCGDARPSAPRLARLLRRP